MEKKIKLIYEDDPKTYLVRYTNGEYEKMPISAAMKLSKQYKIPIGKSKKVQSKKIKLYWGVGMRKTIQEFVSKLPLTSQQKCRNRKRFDKVA